MRNCGGGRDTTRLRFDPFDLSCMEIHLEGRELGKATVLLQGRTRHLAVAGLGHEPNPSAKAKPPVDFLAALRAEQGAASQQALGRLSFASLSTSVKSAPNNNVEA